jgi:hypothetical protein
MNLPWVLPPNQQPGAHISLVFGEMWDTAGLSLKLPRVRQFHTGALRSHQRTWAENDGRSPTTAFAFGLYHLLIRTTKRSAEIWLPSAPEGSQES